MECRKEREKKTCLSEDRHGLVGDREGDQHERVMACSFIWCRGVDENEAKKREKKDGGISEVCSCLSFSRSSEAGLSRV